MSQIFSVPASIRSTHFPESYQIGERSANLRLRIAFSLSDLHACSRSLRELVLRGKPPSTKARQAVTRTHFNRTLKSWVGVARKTTFCYFLTRKKFPHGGRHVGAGDFALGAITQVADLHDTLR